MKWYFHIGPTKTGTTTIQFALHEVRKLLKKKGVLYPKQGIVDGAHHMFNFSWSVETIGEAPYASVLGINEIPTPEELVAHIRNEADSSGVEQIIISSETLWSWKRDRIRILKETLAGEDATIVVGVRPHLERELSMWQEESKHGFMASPGHYLRTYSDSARSSTGMVLTERINIWRDEGFAFQVLPFPPRNKGVPIWDDFLENVLGETVGEVSVPDSLNVSMDYFATRTMQNALRLVAGSDAVTSTLNKEKLLPTKTAFAVRDAAAGRTSGINRPSLPAYGDFLFEEDAGIQAARYAEQYIRDITAFSEISDKPLDIHRFTDSFDPTRIVKTMSEERRKEFLRQANMARQVALQVLQDIEAPGLRTRIRNGIKKSTLVQKIYRR